MTEGAYHAVPAQPADAFRVVQDAALQLSTKRGGQLKLRWVASALSDANDRFRRLRGHRDLKRLIAAPDKRVAAAPPAQLTAA